MLTTPYFPLPSPYFPHTSFPDFAYLMISNTHYNQLLWPTMLMVLIAICLHQHQKISTNHQQKIGLKKCQRWWFRWGKNSTKSTKNLLEINRFDNRYTLMGESLYFNCYPHFFFVLWPKVIAVTKVNFSCHKKMFYRMIRCSTCAFLTPWFITM